MYPFPQLLLIFCSTGTHSGDNNHQLIWMGFKLAVKSKRKITYTKVNRSPSADTVSALFKELLQITGLTKSDYADLTVELAGVETVREASVKTWLYNGVLPSKGSRKTVLRMFERLCEPALAGEWTQAFIDLEIKAKQERKRSNCSASTAEVTVDSSLAGNSYSIAGDAVSRAERIGEERVSEERIDKESVRRKLPLTIRLAERIGQPHRVGVTVIVGTLFLTAVLLFLASFINRVTIVNEIVIADCGVDVPDTSQSHDSEYSVRVIRRSIPVGEQMEHELNSNHVAHSSHSPDSCHSVLSEQLEGVNVPFPQRQRKLVSRQPAKGQQDKLPDGGS